MKLLNTIVGILTLSLFTSNFANAGSHAYTYSGPDISGEKITILGPWLAPEDESFRDVISIFENATGAVVEYGGSDEFEQIINIDCQAGSPPDIAVFPQPGLAANIAATGCLTSLTPDVKDLVSKNYASADSWINLSTYDDPYGASTFYGVFYRVNVKSLVWYSPDNFEDNGYEVPTTMEGLLALTDQMVADGNTPWCIGLGSGGATGWPATDWMEDIMLRTHLPGAYDAWVSNDMKFNDPRVIEAMDFFGSIALNDSYVNGGSKAVATTDFRDSPNGLFTSPAECMMHRQASFIPAFFPEGLEAGVDYDFFYFPAYADKDLGKPVLGGGTVLTATNDKGATNEFMKFLLHPEAHERFMEKGGFLTPHKFVDTSKYASDTFRGLHEILQNATTFRFDGSDLMPGWVGAGSFWTGMVDYTNGKSAAEVADAIQASWEAGQ